MSGLAMASTISQPSGPTGCRSQPSALDHRRDDAHHQFGADQRVSRSSWTIRHALLLAALLLSSCVVPSLQPDVSPIDRVDQAVDQHPGIAPAVPVRLPDGYQLLEVGVASERDGLVVARTTVYNSPRGDAPAMTVCSAATREDLDLCGPTPGGQSEPIEVDQIWVVVQVMQRPPNSAALVAWESAEFTTQLEQVTWLNESP